MEIIEGIVFNFQMHVNHFVALKGAVMAGKCHSSAPREQDNLKLNLDPHIQNWESKRGFICSL